MALCVKRLVPDAVLPSRGSADAVGYDLCSVEESVIPPGRRGVIGTGISVKLPAGVYGRIASRSGLSVKSGIEVGAGVVDPDYTGELKVVLFNHDKRKFVIKKGYRVAQLILEQCLTVPVDEVDELPETVRGADGLGSTGVTTDTNWADVAEDESDGEESVTSN